LTSLIHLSSQNKEEKLPDLPTDSDLESEEETKPARKKIVSSASHASNALFELSTDHPFAEEDGDHFGQRFFHQEDCVRRVYEREEGQR
jgi:hypothetical protein